MATNARCRLRHCVQRAACFPLALIGVGILAIEECPPLGPVFGFDHELVVQVEATEPLRAADAQPAVTTLVVFVGGVVAAPTMETELEQRAGLDHGFFIQSVPRMTPTTPAPTTSPQIAP